ncbi:hypothetical protein DES53_12148 [Roseimicrobium gellanilyticum]|uniref:Uncharacterized protein n=1 Tax=Roseimicrobium gellanilyticum TaxID=748857 RepID=A0A366H391_9BACT|nr:hypothetical protein [Roseimicrobium gellanilyticum]RBP35528.1 hypothetical protein DES53_12148 [Roseimicrobium gellanilyticum]
MALSAGVPDGASMSYLSNADVKVGIDLNRGGAIVFLARAGEENVINNFDLGRQVQLSFFSGPVPFSVNGQQPSEHWEHIGWNPIQAGDDFKHGSKVLEHRNDGQSIYVKTLPLQWPLNNVPGDCTFESWLRLDGAVVTVRARLNNARVDKMQYPARLQELPAVYANAPFHRVVSYTGDQPFSDAPANIIPKSTGKHPWSFWQGTEGWAALLDDNDRGLGLLTPGRTFFTGGFAGKPGPNDTHATSTGYLAGQGQEILDHNIVYEFRYELLAGTLAEIRARAMASKASSSALPAWTFENDRQGWIYMNARDAGWPVRGALQVTLDQEDPQLLSAFSFWRAEEAPRLSIECAIKTSHKTAVVYWQRHGEDAPGAKDFIQFPIQGDGEFHRYEIDLASVPSYKGSIIRLRFDPVPVGSAGDTITIKSVRLMKPR